MHCVLLIQPVLNTMSHVQFEVLSNISSEGDVFDNLLPVRRLDTLEEGLLLCSHYCRWPAELMEKATWLEGCFTPEQYKDDPRLVLGAHPGDITKWETKNEDGKVILTLFISNQRPQARMCCPYDVYDPATSYFPRRRVMDRLWRSALNAAPTREGALVSYFNSLSMLVENGRINELAAASYRPQGQTERDINRVWFTGGWYHSYHVSGYYDRITVTMEDADLGFLEAIPLSQKPENSWEVVGWKPPARTFYFSPIDRFSYIEA